MRNKRTKASYFPYSIQISRTGWRTIGSGVAPVTPPGEVREPFIVVARRIAALIGKPQLGNEKKVTGGELNLFALLNKVYRHIIGRYDSEQNREVLQRGAAGAGFTVSSETFADIVAGFTVQYPPFMKIPTAGANEEFARDTPDDDSCLAELLILSVTMENPALEQFKPLFDDGELAGIVPSRLLTEGLEVFLSRELPVEPFGLSLPEVLRAPIKASPYSLSGQIDFIRKNWRSILPPELCDELLIALDILGEEKRPFFSGPGQPNVLEFLKGGRLGKSGQNGQDYPEFERFSADADWMANVVMIAKMTYVWLGQLAKQYGREIQRLDQIPDEELDRLARWGFTGLWLIGVWERSPASQQIKHIGGNVEAISSAYSLYDYVIAHDLGGDAALENLKERCRQRGIRLASDMVPNHTGISSRWTLEHPDWFVQLNYPPYPGYSFSGPDLSSSADVSMQIEDGYWDRSDAAVVFKHYDHRNGQARYIYHGNDGTSTPWNDTAQLNYLLPEVRETVIQTILHVARQFPIIRFDAAMTLAKKHFQRLWYPQPGHGSGIPSRAEHGMTREAFDAVMPEEFWREVVDRVAVEAPGTLLLAEAFWLMEGYFVRTLGMHRVYNSAFMNMLKLEENAKYRQTVKNVLEFEPEILKRFVNFMNNPDERTAVEQFGKEGKYFGACVLLATMPGLPMFGHGQIEGFHEKYGMEYRRACWDEPVDEHLVSLHEQLIFPLLHRRHVFSGSECFVFYDFFVGDQVNEDVFTYSNRAGDECGLIVYHNRFATTAGWIRTSTAMALKNGEGDRTLIQTSLGEALSLEAGDNVYYSFRDYASGLEYLRSGRELCDNGFFVELNSYQYYAFLDFRKIVDDEAGGWGKLCRFLNGRPVPSLDEEMKQLRYAALIQRYQTLCGLLEEKWSSGQKVSALVTEDISTQLFTELGALLAQLREAGLVLEPEYATSVIVRGTGILGEIFVPISRPLAKRNSGVEIDAPLQDCWEKRLFVCATVLQGVAAVAVLRTSQWMEAYGLDRATADLFRHGETDVIAPLLDPGASARLLAILLDHGELLTDREGATEPELIARIFDDLMVREFLLVHVSGGVEWFNRERWELLVRWLMITALIIEGLVTGEERRIVAVRTASRLIATDLVVAAACSGYNVALMLGATLGPEVEILKQPE